MSHYPDITGFILAGGQSRRMGRDKRRLLVKGTPFLERTRSLLKNLLGREPFLVGDDFSGFTLDPALLLKDAQADRGPLGGLVAALERCDTDWALILAVDLPCLAEADLERLLQAPREEADLLTFSRKNRPEPLVALYRRESGPHWRQRLEEGQLSITEGISPLRWKPVCLSDRSRALENVNTPDDFKRLEDKS